MANTFLVSDTHFGHTGVCQFVRSDGVTPLRPWDCAEAMDEALVDNWNRVVGSKDKVYHLGDVVINRRALKTLSRLNGEKVLVKGNHDIFPIAEYLEHFKDVRGYHVLDMIIMSHIPVHPESKGRFRGNVHGHLHSNRVLKPVGWSDLANRVVYSTDPDPWYYNVSVENIDYTPIAFEVLQAHFAEQV
jgi:calcineurin-like phosphoesterase family protein